MANRTGSPTVTGKDAEFAFAPHRSQGSATGQQASPLGLRPLGAEGRPVSREALAGRSALIEKELVPRLTDLIKALHAASLAGQIGPGEIALLGELQHWLLQLQVEHDDLHLTLKRARRGTKT